MLKDVFKSMEPQNNGQFYFWFQDYAAALKPFTMIFSVDGKDGNCNLNCTQTLK